MEQGKLWLHDDHKDFNKEEEMTEQEVLDKIVRAHGNAYVLESVKK